MSGANRKALPGRHFRASAPSRLGLHLSVLRRPIIRNAASLYGSNIVTSGVGFLFWFLAAHLYTASQVGVASALQSVSQLLAYVALFGLGTLIIAELSESQREGRSILSAAAIVVGVNGAIAGLVCAVVVSLIHTSITQALAGVGGHVLLVAMTVSTTLAFLFDEACIGLLRGVIQLRRNTIFAVGKLIIMVLLYVIAKGDGDEEILLAWTAGAILSMSLVVRRLEAVLPPGTAGPNWRFLIRKRHLVYSHHWLNLSIIAPAQLLPVIVTAIVSPAANAAFYTCMLIIGFVTSIPSQLSTAMFALQPGDIGALRQEVRTMAKICIVLGVITAPALVVSGRWMLNVFNPSYIRALAALTILGFSVIPASIKYTYVNISRVQRNMRRAAGRTTVAAVMEIGCSGLGGCLWGLTGVAIGLMVAYLMEVVWLGPVVWDVIWGSDRDDVSKVELERS